MSEFDLATAARTAMIEAGFAPEFSTAALGEASHAEVPAPDAAGVDLRARPWSSIDNLRSRDLDQVEWVERLDDGRVLLALGIADVDALCPAGGAIDAHAAQNTTSIYTGVTTFSMLPEHLSANLTSLHEDQDRLALVIEMVVHDDGSVSDARARRAIVRNHARFDYADVGAWLEGHGRPPGKLGQDPVLAEQLRLQHEVGGWLRARRRREGALELETTEVRAVSDGTHVVALEETDRNAARSLIEDLMLTANAAIAGLCEAANVSWIRRTVRAPERWQRLVALAAEHADTLPPEPSGTALAQFLLRRKTGAPERYRELSLAVVKLIGKGEYEVERAGEELAGHFGLAVGDYTHGTAPNRRYADLVTQRLLKAAIDGRRAPYGDEALIAIARRCTEREDEARRVERKLRKMSAAAWLAPRVGSYFDAVITGVSKKGTFVRVMSPPVEGRLVRGENNFDVGERLRVRLLATDAAQGHIDFAAAAPRGP